MIKENSPIWQRQNPLCREFLRVLPPKRKPMVAERGFARSIAKVIIRIVCQYFTTIKGSTSIPTETKKIAPKKSFMGLVSFIIFSLITVPERIEPITKAPSASDTPAFMEIATIIRHNPNDIIITVSSVR